MSEAGKRPVVHVSLPRRRQERGSFTGRSGVPLFGTGYGVTPVTAGNLHRRDPRKRGGWTNGRGFQERITEIKPAETVEGCRPDSFSV